jgi:transcription elongation factor Elf1
MKIEMSIADVIPFRGHYAEAYYRCPHCNQDQKTIVYDMASSYRATCTRCGNPYDLIIK